MSDEVDPLNIGALLQINELNLETEMSNCAAHYYMFSKLACEAEDYAEAATLKIEIYETKLTKIIKTENPGITQTDIKRYFREELGWQELRREQLELQKNHNVLEKANSL